MYSVSRYKCHCRGCVTVWLLGRFGAVAGTPAANRPSTITMTITIKHDCGLRTRTFPDINVYPICKPLRRARSDCICDVYRKWTLLRTPVQTVPDNLKLGVEVEMSFFPRQSDGARTAISTSTPNFNFKLRAVSQVV